MILTGVWVLPNAVAAWITRSGTAAGTPDQLRQWTFDVFLGVNLLLGCVVVYVLLHRWLMRVVWHRRTGGLVPRPQPAALLWPEHEVMFPFFFWTLAAGFLETWLALKTWPMQGSCPKLYFLILAAPILILWLLVKSTNRSWTNRIRQEWRTAAVPERVWRASAVIWIVGFYLVLALSSPRLLEMGYKAWFLIPPVLSIMAIGGFVLEAAVALSTGRR